eukprot:TRINITY_DN83402_c0_g1_i1.p1 TRINITY_DN83402_c0_g1~~TRINITY_DN83402_c0_g1_i1.p1  ORF type:complete len:157 (-),score=49.30 TRINITY_DN83402_c0_g1_i1:222-692(-)
MLEASSQQQLQHVPEELRAEVKTSMTALQEQLAQHEVSFQDVLAKQVSHRTSDYQGQRSRVDALELRLTKVQADMLQAMHELKSSLDSMRLQDKPKSARLKGKHSAPESDQRREMQLSKDAHSHQMQLLNAMQEDAAMRYMRAEIMRAVAPCSSLS